MNYSNKMLTDVIHFNKYAKYLPSEGRRETYEETVNRNFAMHAKKFPELADEIWEAYELVHKKKILPSMRSMQFAGKPIELSPARIYNCAYAPADDVAVFSEVMFLLLGGTGVGYSVQKHHVEKLPAVRGVLKNHKTGAPRTRRYLVDDSINGWADAVKVLMEAYFYGKSKPRFDFSDIRPKGARLVTSGGKAPGPQPLMDCLYNVEKVLVAKERDEKLRPIEVHDIMCHIADAVLAGGIRRAALISLFSLDDDEMLCAKYGTWWELNPQRGRANNSAVVMRHRVTEEDFMRLWERIKASGAGEPGFIFSNDRDMGTNPCAEIALKPGQMCNLVELNASDVVSQEDLEYRARMAARIATLQASYTDFHYLREIWRETTEKEALIGVGMTGIASGKVLELDMRAAAEAVKDENEKFAKKLGINPAARTTTVKPSGSSSLILGCSSGVHAWHDEYYIRNVRLNKNEPLCEYLTENHPELVEDEQFEPTKTSVVGFPQKAPEGAITRAETALEMLERVRRMNVEWIHSGHRKGANKNNVSATVTIKNDEWDEVAKWMWENRESYTALSILPHSDHTYVQPPFDSCSEEVYNEKMKVFKNVDLTQVKEENDNTNLKGEIACAGGACEV